MTAAELTIEVEAKTYGLWRVVAVTRLARFLPPRMGLWLIRKIVPTAGVKVRAAGQPWERNPLQVEEQGT